jgi:hypothetical protein
MSIVFSREGWRRLSTSWVLLVGAAVAGSTVVYGSYWYGVKEKRDSASGQHLLQDARGRLDNARRERDSLNESADVFRTLVERGLLQREQRLDLVELVNTLRSRHQLYSLDYEIAPQRTLPLAGARVFSSIDVQASRVTLKARGLHEGDLLGFISDLSRSRQGFYPVDRCNLRRVLGPAETLQAHVEADCTLEWITLKDKHANRPG